MKIKIRMISIVIILISFKLHAQIEGLSKSQIVEKKISGITAKLDVSNDNPIYENLVVREFKFDKLGNCISSKYLYPFYDVVATTDEYFSNFDSLGNITKKVWVHRTVGISKQGKNYIQLFGETNDTTITINYFNKSNQIIEEKTFKTGEKDTIVTIYKYNEALLIESEHFNSSIRGQLNNENFIRSYEYDELNRNIIVLESPTKIKGESQKIINYIGNTSKVKSKVHLNDFKWVMSINNGEKSITVTQDSLNGAKDFFEYDKFGNIVKETTYRDLTDSLSNFYGKIYKYEEGLLREKSSFNESSDIINLTDKIQYIYNDNRLLKEVKYIYNGKRRRSHHYEYQIEK